MEWPNKLSAEQSVGEQCVGQQRLELLTFQCDVIEHKINMKGTTVYPTAHLSRYGVDGTGSSVD